MKNFTLSDIIKQVEKIVVYKMKKNPTCIDQERWMYSHTRIKKKSSLKKNKTQSLPICLT